MEQITTGEKAVALLKKYAELSGFPIRSTSDISPLEDWLLAELIKSNDTVEQLYKFAENRDQ